MAGRYTNWHHRRGARDRPDLDSYGRKLLEYLREQRARGAKTQKITRTLPDGSVVTAEFVGDQPIVEIQVGTGGGPKQAITVIDGFVVRPSVASDQAANANKDHIVLQPTRGERFVPYFFSAAEIPDPAPEGARTYEFDAVGSSLFPDGLLYAGNVDWRNGNESQIISWYGHAARYKGTRIADATQVFYKGKVLFDLSAVEMAVVGETSGLILGACLRSIDGTPWLLVMVNYFDHEVCLGVRLHVPRVSNVPGAGGAQQAELAMLWDPLDAVDPDMIRVLHDQSIEVARQTNSVDCPWFFNQSGTEARRIYMDTALDDYTTIECVLDLRDFDLPVYSDTDITPVNSEDDVLTEVVTVDPDTYLTIPVVALGTNPNVSITAPQVTSTEGFEVRLTAGVDPDPIYTEYTRTQTSSKGFRKFAVDFVGDVPVYAELSSNNLNGVVTVVRALTYEYTFSGNATGSSGSDVVYTLDFTDEGTGSLVRTEVGTYTSVLRLPWRDVSVVGTRNYSYTGDCSGTYALQRTDTYPWNAVDGQWDGGDVDIAVDTRTATGTATISDTSVAKTLEVFWLDLRYEMLATLQQTSTTTRTGAADYAWAHRPSEGGVLSDDDWAIDQDLTQVLHYEVAVGDVVVFSDTGTPVVTPNDSSGTIGDRILEGISDITSNTVYYRYAALYNLFTTAISSINLALEFPVDGLPLVEYDTSTSGASLDSGAFYPSVGQDFTPTDDHYGTSSVSVGSWQTYKNRFCFSSIVLSDPTTWAQAVGHTNGTVYAATLYDLTAVDPISYVRFYPVWVLAPTAYNISRLVE